MEIATTTRLEARGGSILTVCAQFAPESPEDTHQVGTQVLSWGC